MTPTDTEKQRLRDHIHAKGLGYAGPYRCGIAAGELGLAVEPWWQSPNSNKNFRAGVVIGAEWRAKQESIP